MPKPMLERPMTQIHTNTILSATNSQKQGQQSEQIDKMRLDKYLRKSRSKKYMEALHKLDAGGHANNQHMVNEIIGAIRSEFPELDISGILLGIVSKCYLGRPYEVHSLDFTGEIIEHYMSGDVLSAGLEKARSIAMHGGYDVIEVYIDCCRAISSNGSVSVIHC